MQRIITGIGAALILLLLLVGLPALLVLIGPVGLPHVQLTPAGLWAALLTPDDGTLFLTLIKVAGWAVWALLVVAVAAEAIAAVRRIRPPSLAGLALPQAVARGLIAAIIALFINTNTAFGSPAPVAAHAAPMTPAPTEHGDSHVLPADRVQPSYERYTVKKGDILSQLALDHLGDAHRYPEIYKASRSIHQPGGQRLTDPDVIDIGWKLNIPTGHGHDDRPKPTSNPPDRATAKAPAPDARDSQPTAPTPEATAPIVSTAPASAPATSKADQQAEQHTDDGYRPEWLLTGLSGAGAILAGGLWLILQRRRAIQHHHRRPGFMTSAPPPATLPVEKTLRYEGRPIADIVTFIDETLRRLAATILESADRHPPLIAVEVARSSLTLHLGDSTPLPEPWRRSEGRNSWTITTADDPDAVGPLAPDGPAPWPHLTTVGADDTGHRWLLNLEHFGTVNITGDDDYAHDLARYIAAEVATNPWARDLEIDLIGVFHEIVGLSPSRCHHHAQRSGVDDSVAAAVEMADRMNRTNSTDTTTARMRHADDELWLSRVVVGQHDQSGMFDELVKLIDTMPLRTATATLIIDPKAEGSARIELVATADGRLRMPSLGLDLVGNGMTADEARGCVQLLRAADDLSGAPVPPAKTSEGEPWREFCDAAGRLRDEFTEPRHPDGRADAGGTNVPQPDQVVVESAATTAEDLAVLSPVVPAATETAIQDADPTLDADLEAWFGPQGHRPKLAVLGHMTVRVAAGQENDDTARRRPYYMELVAYLASRENGATTDELRKAFDANGDRIRRDLATVRGWLGSDPITHESYLPAAVQVPIANGRTTGHYDLRGVLYDADLFRRLRVRGQARGPQGIEDFMRALSLVNGRPYEDIRKKGGIWLSEHREDQNLLVAIVDTAHLAATMATQTEDFATARRAAQVAIAAAPDEDVPKLDLAKAAKADGREAETDEIVRALGRQCDVDGPVSLGRRTEELMSLHGASASAADSGS
jgi:hypothetical protein